MATQVQDTDKAGELAFLAPSLPYIEKEVRRMEDATINRVMTLIREQKLTPELAAGLWMEIWSLRSLMKRFEVRMQLPTK